MSHELKIGDRIRVTARCRMSGYSAGDKGTVLEGPVSYAGASDQSYVVAMDKDGPGSTTAVFGTDDIEPDG
jgi:hypothetical protein